MLKVNWVKEVFLLFRYLVSENLSKMKTMAEKVRVLLVEDDEVLSFVISDNLIEKGFEVRLERDGEAGLRAFQEQTFDICLLDVMMPKMDGFTLAKSIRDTDRQIPIVFLTARSMAEDRVKGLALGADDYLCKPFSMEELVLRINNIMRRIRNLPQLSSRTHFTFDSYEFNYETLALTYNGELIKELTNKEAKLMKMFCERPNTVLTRSEILQEIWGDDDYFLGRSLDVFISRLRKYLNKSNQVNIVNLHGIGFRFEVPA